MTFFCHAHPDWEGPDIGKIHDHIEKDHADGLRAETREEMMTNLRRIVKQELFEIAGPVRLGDRQWLNRYHGRPPKIGNLMGENETET